MTQAGNIRLSFISSKQAQSRPFDLARYMARSATAINSSERCGALPVVTPALAVTCMKTWATGKLVLRKF